MMRFLGSIIGCLLITLYVGCSDSDSTAGIEIGNPEVASKNIGLTADFSIDYSDAKQIALAKSASDDENVVIDTFRLTLTEVRSYCSFYVGVSVLPDVGLILWPYEDNRAAVLPISFTDGEVVEEAFANINLQAEGRLKEIGVSFQIERKKNYNSIYGRILVNDKYVPFVYELSRFQLFSLKYHYSQIDVRDTVVNLSVAFRVHRFVDGLDLSSAKVDEDGVIRISEDSNEEIWAAMNDRFVPSFQALRYEYTNDDGKTVKDYVDDALDNLNNVFYENVVTNGDFKDDDDDWIFLTQLNGAADMAIVKDGESSVARIRVTDGGDSLHSVQLLHENISVAKGAKYKFIFTIWSDVETRMVARLGSYITYETIGFEDTLKVGKKHSSYEIEFTGEVTEPFGRLDLNLGAKEATFWIKDVQIFRTK